MVAAWGCVQAVALVVDGLAAVPFVARDAPAAAPVVVPHVPVLPIPMVATELALIAGAEVIVAAASVSVESPVVAAAVIVVSVSVVTLLAIVPKLIVTLAILLVTLLAVVAELVVTLPVLRVTLLAVVPELVVALPVLWVSLLPIVPLAIVVSWLVVSRSIAITSLAIVGGRGARSILVASLTPGGGGGSVCRCCLAIVCPCGPRTGVVVVVLSESDAAGKRQRHSGKGSNLAEHVHRNSSGYSTPELPALVGGALAAVLVRAEQLGNGSLSAAMPAYMAV